MLFSRLQLPAQHAARAVRTSSAVTIGNFDGLHLGHQELLAELERAAEEQSLSKVLLSFYPHPKLYFEKKKGNRIRSRHLTPLAEKISYLRDFGIDYFFALRFNEYSSQMSASSFVEEVLLRQLQAKKVIIGHDWCFGRNRTGNTDVLTKMGERLGFEVIVVPKVSIADSRVSSSLVRELLAKGDVRGVSEQLGRYYMIRGAVAHGASKGAGLGFPTANIVPGAKVLPIYGVYASITETDEGRFKSVTNIGIRPTVTNDVAPTVETHILDLDRELYGKRISVFLVDFLREEKRFSGVDELRRQIECDVANARDILKGICE